jgi:hypothetical protein
MGREAGSHAAGKEDEDGAEKMCLAELGADTGVGEEALQSTSTPAPSRCLGGLGQESDSNGGRVICNSHRGGPRLRLPLGRGWS